MEVKVFHKIGYGVYLVSSVSGEQVNGQTANALMQVTSEPQQIAIGINKNNLTHQFVKASRRVAVTILAQDAPVSLIGRFGFKSGREIDKFEGINHRICQNGCPVVVEHSVGYLEGKVVEEIDVGTHTVFIVGVEDAKMLRDVEPMTYAYYHQVKRGTTPKTAPTYIEENTQEREKSEKYQCTDCGYIYDPDQGDPENGIPAGTPFAELPDDWVCPVCGAPKSEFVRVK